MIDPLLVNVIKQLTKPYLPDDFITRSSPVGWTRFTPVLDVIRISLIVVFSLLWYHQY